MSRERRLPRFASAHRAALTLGLIATSSGALFAAFHTAAAAAGLAPPLNAL